MQREWMEGRITDDSEFWYTVGLIYSQFQGLMEGYNSVALNNYVSLLLHCILLTTFLFH